MYYLQLLYKSILSLLNMFLAKVEMCADALVRLYAECPILLSDFNWNVLTNFSKSPNTEFYEYPLSASRVATYGQTDGHTGVGKPIALCCFNFLLRTREKITNLNYTQVSCVSCVCKSNSFSKYYSFSLAKMQATLCLNRQPTRTIQPSDLSCGALSAPPFGELERRPKNNLNHELRFTARGMHGDEENTNS